MNLKNNNVFNKKYEEIYKKLIGLKDSDDINEIFTSDKVAASLGDILDSEYVSIAIYSAYHDFLKNNPGKDKDDVITNECIRMLKNKGINISLETLSDEELSNKYAKAVADKKQIGETIDALTAQNLRDAIQEHKENGPKRKTNIAEEKIMEKVDYLGLSSEDKKIVINFVVDPSVGERKTTPITSLSKNKFRLLRNTITKYLKWLEEKNLKVEPEEIINDKGEKQTVVYIKNGEIFNITLSCTNLVKEGINKGVEKMKKAKDNIEDTRGGIKNTLNKIFERKKLRKEFLKNKLKQKFAPVADYAGVVAEKLSKKADDFGHKAYDRADEMKNAEVIDLQERLERLKKKNGVAVGGNTVEFMGPPENQAGMSI